MLIEIDEGSGFCFGVTTAIKKAEEELAKSESLYCLGDIVHNGREVERLNRMGLITVGHEDLERLHDTKMLLRAHGEPPLTYSMAKEHNISVIDATCPVVLNLQKRIRKAYEEGGQIVIYGKNGHAEVVGLVGQTDGTAIVIENLEDAKRLDFSHDIQLFSQTTKSLEGFREIVGYIEQNMKDGARFNYFDTICRRVANRIPDIRKFAAQHDVILFVCGRKSSNGKVLYNECLSVNPRTYMIDDPAEIDFGWLEGVESVGICGATSTPKWLMEESKRRIEEKEKKKMKKLDYEIIELPKIVDPRGNLTVAEQMKNVPFDIKRVYWTYDVPGGESRGGHAHKRLYQLVVAVSGSFTVTLDNGWERETILLNHPWQGLLIKPGLWRTLDDFSSGAVCMVLASELFDLDDYIYEYEDFLKYVGNG